MRVTLTIPDKVWDALKAQAEMERRTASNLAVLILEKAVGPKTAQITNLARGTIEASFLPADATITETSEHEVHVPPLDAEGIPPDSTKGKTDYRRARGAAPRAPGEMSAEEAIRRGRGIPEGEDAARRRGRDG